MSATKENTLDIAAVWSTHVDLRDGTTVLVSALSRQNLLRAASVRFPEVPGNAWFRATSDTIRDAIASGIVPDLSPTGDGPPTTKQVNYLHALQRAAGETVSTPATKGEAGRMIDALKAATPPVSAPVSAPETIVPTPAPVAAVAPQGAPEDLLRQALEMLAQGITPASPLVDEEYVRAIVDAAVEAAKITPREILVKHSNGVRVTLTKRTHRVFAKVLKYAARGYHVLLVGPAGSGKSTIAQQVYEALGHEGEIPGMSYGPNTPTSKVLGYMDANGSFVGTPYHDAFAVRGCPFLGDELDNGHPGLVAELNQSLSNGAAAFAVGNLPKVDGFVFIGTANTFGRGGDRMFIGRNQLDAATLDRFKVVHVDYDEDLETEIALGMVDVEHHEAAAAFIAKVRRHRANVLRHALPVVVSPRSVIDGVDIVFNLDIPEDEALEDLYLGGLDEDLLRKVTA